MFKNINDIKFKAYFNVMSGKFMAYLTLNRISVQLSYVKGINVRLDPSKLEIMKGGVVKLTLIRTIDDSSIYVRTEINKKLNNIELINSGITYSVLNRRMHYLLISTGLEGKRRNMKFSIRSSNSNVIFGFARQCRKYNIDPLKDDLTDRLGNKMKSRFKDYDLRLIRGLTKGSNVIAKNCVFLKVMCMRRSGTLRSGAIYMDPSNKRYIDPYIYRIKSLNKMGFIPKTSITHMNQLLILLDRKQIKQTQVDWSNCIRFNRTESSWVDKFKKVKTEHEQTSSLHKTVLSDFMTHGFGFLGLVKKGILHEVYYDSKNKSFILVAEGKGTEEEYENMVYQLNMHRVPYTITNKISEDNYIIRIV